MNKNLIDTLTAKNIKRWLGFQTGAIILAFTISFLVVEYSVFGQSISLEMLPKMLAGFLIVMISIFFINIVTARWMMKQISDLANGLEAAAHGDYHAKLDPSKTSVFVSVYNNFNKLEEELKKSNTLQDEFVNNYSHEFKTPITSIKGFAELLLEDDVDKETQKKYLKIIAEESERLTYLANSSILLTKLNSQEILPRKSHFYIDEQIRRVLIILEPECSKRNIDLSCNLEEVRYFGNEEIMEHLWLNLISNAIKYTPDGGRVSVNLREYSETIIFSVIDSGIGISENDIKHIFNKFFQVDKSKTTKGLGLGLTIVNRIVQMIEGKITVESELNKGSKFTVTIHKD